MVSVSVPMEAAALLRAAKMFNGLAEDLSADLPKACRCMDATLDPEPGEAPPITQTACNAVAFEGGPRPSTGPVPDEVQRTETASATATVHTEDPAKTLQKTPPAEVAAPAVELADGIPWDARIHGSGRTKYAAPPHGWKTKRGVDPALVESVTAELQAAMAVPVASAPAPGEAAVAFGQTAIDGFQPVLATAIGPITTFVELNLAITSQGISPAAVATAVRNAGLEGYPLLAARPDLIPTVAAELFPPQEG